MLTTHPNIVGVMPGLIVLLVVCQFPICELTESIAVETAAIDVTTFGAKADGETDDTVAIRKAIDSK